MNIWQTVGFCDMVFKHKFLTNQLKQAVDVFFPIFFTQVGFPLAASVEACPLSLTSTHYYTNTHTKIRSGELVMNSGKSTCPFFRHSTPNADFACYKNQSSTRSIEEMLYFKL
jgi:hypothetical protein